jgi:hypothetical protein
MPESTCPDDIWIGATFPLPSDDRTAPDGFSYLVSVLPRGSSEPSDPWSQAQVLLHAETIFDGYTVNTRFGESECGCIPSLELKANEPYEVRLWAIDAAGNRSPTPLFGEITLREGDTGALPSVDGGSNASM